MMRRSIRLFCSTSATGVVPSGQTVSTTEVAISSNQPDSLVRRRRRVMAWFSAPGYDLQAAHKLITTSPLTSWGVASSSGKGSDVATIHTYPLMCDPEAAAAVRKAGDLKVAKNKSTSVSPSTAASGEQPPRSSLEGGVTSSKALDVLCVTASAVGGTGGRPTYVIFADGGLVGWDSTWPEMLAIRKHLGKAVQSAGAYNNNKGQGRMSRFNRDSTKTNLLSKTADRHTILETLTYETYDEYRSLQTHHAVADADASSGGTARAVDAVIQADDDHASSALHRASATEDFVVPEDERNFVDSSSDTIVINNDTDHKSKIAFSYALGQSVKLDAIDHAVAPLSGELKRWQTRLASTGKILCSLTTLRKSKTHTMSLLEDLNFKQHIDTSPKIFWSGDYQHLRSVYKSACGHLEIGERGTALKTKLDTIDDSVTYLHHEVHASSNEFLTWVIIWLILAELLQAMGMFATFEERIFKKEHSASRGWFKDRAPPADDAKEEANATTQTE